MKTVTVLKEHSFGGRVRRVGQTYDVSDAIAILFVKIGRVIETPRLVVKRPLPVPVTRDIEPEPEESEKEPEKRQRRRYKRRDMKAED